MKRTSSEKCIIGPKENFKKIILHSVNTIYNFTYTYLILIVYKNVLVQLCFLRSLVYTCYKTVL